jgi:hypothetical protein
MMQTKYKHQDNVQLRKNIETLLVASLQDLLGVKLIHKVHSSSITHTDLLPEGDQFTISVVIETHEKKEPTP